MRKEWLCIKFEIDIDCSMYFNYFNAQIEAFWCVIKSFAEYILNNNKLSAKLTHQNFLIIYYY